MCMWFAEIKSEERVDTDAIAGRLKQEFGVEAAQLPESMLALLSKLQSSTAE